MMMIFKYMKNNVILIKSQNKFICNRVRIDEVFVDEHFKFFM